MDDDGLGPPIKDLTSAPWSNNPVLVDSAWKRVRKREWKWAEICGDDPVKAERKKAGVSLVKFKYEYKLAKAEWEKANPKKSRKKRRKEEDGEDEGEDEDERSD